MRFPFLFENICVLNAEERFLPHLKKLHGRFPKLRIVLEHATTRAAVEVVKTLGDTVACTITAHHLALTVDDWAGQSFHFCKPVARFPDDRSALQEVIREGLEFALSLGRSFCDPLCSGHPRFFLGSDSAPHLVTSKYTATPAQSCAAGVYTSPVLLPLVAHLLKSFGALDKIQGFVSDNGRRFYQKPARFEEVVRLRRLNYHVEEVLSLGADDVIPFWAGKDLQFSLVSS